jgi:hypothetical protein
MMITINNTIHLVVLALEVNQIFHDMHIFA